MSNWTVSLISEGSGMKMRVKLYGTLSRYFPGYQYSQGIEVEVPAGATVQDLLTLLKIPEYQGALVAIEGKILKTEDHIQGRALVHVLQPLSGG
jgi:sulfur carrier protein ThiS